METTRWQSGNYHIAQSSHHKGMFIITDGGNGFWNISSSFEIMIKKYPPGADVKVQLPQTSLRPRYITIDGVPVYGNIHKN